MGADMPVMAEGIDDSAAAIAVEFGLERMRHRRAERAASPAEDRHAPCVPLIGFVEPADQRAGINDGSYLHSLRGAKGRTGL